MKNRVLIITGMHRSGTSLVASVLQHAGVHIGTELMGPFRGNPRGHFEDLDFTGLHERVLRRGGRTVYVRDGSPVEPPGPDDTEAARRLIEQREHHELWGFKDPRSSLFLDFWHDLLPEAVFLFVYRHPIEVALSLLERRSEIEVLTDPLAGISSWQRYNEAILAFYRQHPERCFLGNIHSIARDVEPCLAALGRKLDLPLDGEGAQNLVHPEELGRCDDLPALGPVLRQILPGVADLQDELSSRADLGDPEPAARHADSESLEKLDELAHLLRRGEAGEAAIRPLFSVLLSVIAPQTAAACNAELPQRISRLEQQLQELDIHSGNLEALREQDRGTLRELTVHAANLEKLLAEREAKLETQVGELEALHLRAEGHHRELQAHAENLEGQRHEGETEIAALRARVAELQAQEQGVTRDLRQLIARRDDELAGFQAHAENLEKLRDEDRQRIEELTDQAEQLVEQRTIRERERDDFRAHAANLEELRDQDQSVIGELEAHARNLELKLEQMAAQLVDFEAHAGNLATAGQRHEKVIEDLEAHAGNLATAGQRQEKVIEDLEAHAGNLEAARQRHEQLIEDLEAHAGNLQLELEQRRRQLSELETHADALAAARQLLQDQVEGLLGHTANLERERQHDLEQLTELEAQTRRLAAAREGQQELIVQLSSLAESQQQDLERGGQEIERLGAEVEALEAEGRERERLLAERNRQLATHQRQIEQLQVDAAAAEDEIHRLRRELEQTSARLDRLESSRAVRTLRRLRLLQ